MTKPANQYLIRQKPKFHFNAMRPSFLINNANISIIRILRLYDDAFDEGSEH